MRTTLLMPCVLSAALLAACSTKPPELAQAPVQLILPHPPAELMQKLPPPKPLPR